jgi:hypothetical protein
MSTTPITSAPAVTPAVAVRASGDEPQKHNKRKKAFHRDPIDVRFARWAAKNPDIIELLLKFAIEAKQAGSNRFGIAAIVQRVRWEINLTSRGDEPFKISNDFTSRLARLLMQMDPILEGFFELRPLRSVAVPSEDNPQIKQDCPNAEIN